MGRRPIFETERDVRAFLTLVALAVRAGLIELHSYAILATHYHLLVSCPNGDLSLAMQWIQDVYARWFNRTRGRDGHVFQGRFISRRVEDPVYLVTVVSYIDQNPCDAGIAGDPREYPHGSARWYAAARSPRWLHRGLVEDHVRALARAPAYLPRDYPVLWKTCAAWSGRELAARHLAVQRVAVAPLLNLTRAGPVHVQRWMRRNALNESGHAVPCLLIPAKVAVLLVRGRAAMEVRRGRRVADEAVPDAALRAVGLLRSAAGLRLEEIGEHLGISCCTVKRYLVEHARHMARDPAYAAALSGMVHEGLVRAYGGVLEAQFPELMRHRATIQRAIHPRGGSKRTPSIRAVPGRVGGSGRSGERRGAGIAPRN